MESFPDLEDLFPISIWGKKNLFIKKGRDFATHSHTHAQNNFWCNFLGGEKVIFLSTEQNQDIDRTGSEPDSKLARPT